MQLPYPVLSLTPGFSPVQPAAPEAQTKPGAVTTHPNTFADVFADSLWVGLLSFNHSNVL